MELENNIDQPKTESNVNENQPKNETYFVNGRDMTAEEVVADHKKLQKTLTEKFQSKAEDEKNGQKVADAEATLKQAEVDKSVRAQQNTFNAFKEDFSSLSENQLKIIDDLQASNPTKSYEEVARDYGMVNDSQIEIARGNRGFSGESFAAPGKKTEKVEMSSKLKRTLNFKTSDERNDIKSRFGL